MACNPTRAEKVCEVFRKIFDETTDSATATAAAQLVFERAGVALLDWAFAPTDRREELAELLWASLVEMRFVEEESNAAQDE